MSDEAIRDISDASQHGDSDAASPDEEVDGSTMPRSPPSRPALERDTTRLRSKYKILKTALQEERIAQIDDVIEKLEATEQRTGDAVGMDELARLEARRREKLAAAHRRKRVRVEAIIEDYKSRVQAIQNEKEVPCFPSDPLIDKAAEKEILRSQQRKHHSRTSTRPSSSSSFIHGAR